MWSGDFNAGKTQLVLFDRNNDAIDVKMDGYVLEEYYLKMLGFFFSSKLD